MLSKRTLGPLVHLRAACARWLLRLFVAGVYLFLYVPIAVLIIFSFNKASFPSRWVGFTWHWYQDLAHQTFLWAALRNSLTIAVAATILSLILSLFFVFYLMQSRRLERLVSLFYTNLLVPEILLAVGLLGAFSFLSIPLGRVSLVIAHTVLGMGYAIPIIYARFLELDTKLTEAALDLGATVGQTYRSITLPLLRPSIFAAALLVFILSFDDFVLAYFCSGPTTQTLPLFLLSLLRTEMTPTINALSAILLMFSGSLVVAFCSLNVRTKVF